MGVIPLATAVTDPIGKHEISAKNPGMTRAMVIPDGEFSFQEFCKANPSTLPVNNLKFLTLQTKLGNLKKNKIPVGKETHATYVAVAPNSAVNSVTGVTIAA
jgi:hypothetical protein